MTLNSTDEALMVAVREGARSDLRILFERHHRAIYEFFFRMTGDRAVSENLVLAKFVTGLGRRRNGCRNDDTFMHFAAQQHTRLQMAVRLPVRRRP